VTLHLIFNLAGTEYAVPVDAVIQMETFTGATLVPGSPSFVAGVVTIRGRLVPVIDLRLRFGLPPAEIALETRLIVTDTGGRVVALRVDGARELLRLDVAAHQPPPPVLVERAGGLVSGMHSLGKRLLLLVDLRKILGETSHDLSPHALLEDDASKARAALPA